jgi:hypothetical protein
MLNGSPVTGGSLTFSPIASEQTEAGKPATGTVQPDGTFTLGTYKPGDGAVIGRHRVSYSAPSPDAATQPPADGGHDQGPPPSPYAGLVPETKEVEVASGENNITIELVKP